MATAMISPRALTSTYCTRTRKTSILLRVLFGVSEKTLVHNHVVWAFSGLNGLCNLGNTKQSYRE